MDDHVSDRIRKARRTADLTQSQAAQALGVHRGTFGHWERGGGHLPTSANLLHLGQTLDVSYEWLATGHGECKAFRSTARYLLSGWIALRNPNRKNRSCAASEN